MSTVLVIKDNYSMRVEMSTLIKLRIKCKLETLLKVKAALFLMIINIEPVQSKVWIHPDMLSKFFSYCT